jgi:uncharacterized alpha-E superfamily protein
VKFCLNGMRSELSRLKNPAPALRHVERARRRLSRFNAETASWAELHQFIDRIQLDLSKLSHCISESWFLPTER